MERPCQAPRFDGVLLRPAFRPTGGTPAFGFRAGRRVFPPEPPAAITVWPERRGDVKGAPVFGAAKRTLDVEHRSGPATASAVWPDFDLSAPILLPPRC